MENDGTYYPSTNDMQTQEHRNKDGFEANLTCHSPRSIVRRHWRTNGGSGKLCAGIHCGLAGVRANNEKFACRVLVVVLAVI